MGSSGGRIFQDQNNPWFLKNHGLIKYCVEIDQNSISADELTINESIEYAIKYWKKEFGKAVYSGSRAGEYEQGYHSWKKEECSDKTDLKIQFGYGTLNAEQIKFLKNPKKFIGVAVREKYDLEKLKASGYIYIASDYGKNSYQRGESLIAKAWSYKKLLRYALIHELGHIHGVPHMGKGVMSETFLDIMLNKDRLGTMLNFPIAPFVAVDRELDSCNLKANQLAFYGLSGSTKCLKLKEISPLSRWKVFADGKEIGEFKATALLDIHNSSIEPVGFLWLNPKQKVYNSNETGGKMYMTGPSRRETLAEAAFYPKGTPFMKKVRIVMTPSSITFLGAVKNDVLPVFAHRSLLSLYLYGGEDSK